MSILMCTMQVRTDWKANLTTNLDMLEKFLRASRYFHFNTTKDRVYEIIMTTHYIS